MKIEIFTIAALFLTIQGNAQIFNSGFENNNGTPLSSYKTINVDGNQVASYAPVQDFNTKAWIQFYDGFDNKIAFSTSYYDPAGTSNDWLITPSIEIPTDGNPTMYWKAKSYDGDFQDSYDIKISTSDDAKESFTTTLLSVDGEQAYDYNSRKLDLSAYKGQTIYIAIVNKTTDGLFLAFDDLYISNSDKCELPSLDGFNATNLTENSFTANWNATAGILKYDTGVTNFIDPVQSAGIETATSKGFTNLQPATRYQFFLKNADCGSGWAGPKSVFTPSTLPYNYDFEYTDENYGEYDSDGWVSSTWINGDGTSAQNGEGYVFNNTSKTSAKNDWLFSYPIKVTAGQSITIKYFATLSLATATPANLKISIASKPDKNSLTQELTTNKITGDGYKEYSSIFTPTETGTVYVGFGNVTPAVESQASLRLDNVKILKGNLQTSESLSKNLIKFYPNPVKAVLNIDSTDKLQSVEIFNAEGRKVLESNANNKVNMQNLPKGIYIVKVKTEAGIITKKIIKQ